MNETYLAYGVLIAAALFLLPFFFAAMVGYNPTSESTVGRLKQAYFVGLGVFLGLSFIAAVAFSITWALVTVMK